MILAVFNTSSGDQPVGRLYNIEIKHKLWTGDPGLDLGTKQYFFFYKILGLVYMLDWMLPDSWITE